MAAATTSMVGTSPSMAGGSHQISSLGIACGARMHSVTATATCYPLSSSKRIFKSSSLAWNYGVCKSSSLAWNNGVCRTSKLSSLVRSKEPSCNSWKTVTAGAAQEFGKGVDVTEASSSMGELKSVGALMKSIAIHVVAAAIVVFGIVVIAAITFKVSELMFNFIVANEGRHSMLEEVAQYVIGAATVVGSVFYWWYKKYEEDKQNELERRNAEKVFQNVFLDVKEQIKHNNEQIKHNNEQMKEMKEKNKEQNKEMRIALEKVLPEVRSVMESNIAQRLARLEGEWVKSNIAQRLARLEGEWVKGSGGMSGT